jgi:hypothetical protein
MQQKVADLRQLKQTRIADFQSNYLQRRRDDNEHTQTAIIS